MLLMYLFAGQAPRSTEFFSLEWENRPASSHELYVHRGSMVYATLHRKARHSTNCEFQVARYLPAQVGQLVLLYLVYIRPFVQMLCRVCCGQDRRSRLLFHTPEALETPWTAQILSNHLNRYAQEVLGVSLITQTYRQLSIAITEKHFRQIHQPSNPY